MTTKSCSTCKKVLPVKEFYPHRRMKSGLQSNCRTCARQWHRDRPDYVRRKNAQWKKKNPTYMRDWQRLKNFGITREQVCEMLRKQKNRCAGCNKSFGGRLLEHVDHCHKSGNVRGLLCRICNLVLGMLDDDMTILRRLAKYLIRHQSEAEAYT